MWAITWQSAQTTSLLYISARSTLQSSTYSETISSTYTKQPPWQEGHYRLKVAPGAFMGEKRKKEKKASDLQPKCKR